MKTTTKHVKFATRFLCVIGSYYTCKIKSLIFKQLQKYKFW